MKVKVISLEGVFPALVEEAAFRLTLHRGEQPAQRFLHRAQSCVGESAVRLEAMRLFGIRNGQVELMREEGGKPFLSGRENFHFNLSHSCQLVACAFSEAPVGVDIERCARRETDAIAARCFSAEEQAQILSSADPLEQFYRLWTAKESALKRIGKGVSALQEAYAPEEELITTRFRAQNGERYVLSICGQSHEIDNTSIEFLNANEVLREFLACP